MNKNTSVQTCSKHFIFVNLIVSGEKGEKGNGKYQQGLVCPQCYTQSINTDNVPILQKRVSPPTKCIYLCKQAKQFYQEWTEGLISILKNYQNGHAISNPSKVLKIFTIPQSIGNQLPSNVIWIVHAVVKEQLVLLQQNLQFIMYFQWYNLNHQTFVTDLYHIIMGSGQYSVCILLENFRKMLGEGGNHNKKMKVKEEEIRRIRFSKKFIKKLNLLKENILKRYNEDIIFDCNKDKNYKYSSSKIIGQSHFQEETGNLQYSDVIQKNVIIWNDDQQYDEKKEQKKKERENITIRNICSMKDVGLKNMGNYVEQSFAVLPELGKNSYGKKWERNILGKGGNQIKQKVGKQFNGFQQGKMIQQFSPIQNKQIANSFKIHCYTSQKKQQKQPSQYHSATPHAIQIKPFNFNTSKFDSLQSVSLANNCQEMPDFNMMSNTKINSAKQERYHAHPRQNINRVGLTNLEYIDQIINKISKENNKLVDLKQTMVEQIIQINKIINLLPTINTRMSPQNININTQNINISSDAVSKQKSEFLQKQYLTIRNKIQQYKCELLVKSNEIKILQQQLCGIDKNKNKNNNKYLEEFTRNIGSKHRIIHHVNNSNTTNSQSDIGHENDYIRGQVTHVEQQPELSSTKNKYQQQQLNGKITIIRKLQQEIMQVARNNSEIRNKYNCLLQLFNNHKERQLNDSQQKCRKQKLKTMEDSLQDQNHDDEPNDTRLISFKQLSQQFLNSSNNQCQNLLKQLKKQCIQKTISKGLDSMKGQHGEISAWDEQIRKLIEELISANEKNSCIRIEMQKMYDEIIRKINGQLVEEKKLSAIQRNRYEQSKKQLQKKYNRDINNQKSTTKILNTKQYSQFHEKVCEQTTDRISKLSSQTETEKQWEQENCSLEVLIEKKDRQIGEFERREYQMRKIVEMMCCKFDGSENGKEMYGQFVSKWKKQTM